MSCEQSEMWMIQALDGTLTGSGRGRMMAHLETCPRCRAEWDALGRLEEMLARPPMAFPAPGFVGRVEARLDRFETQRRTLIGGLILLGAAVALCLLALPALLNGRSPLQAYGAFLWRAYELLSYGLVLAYKMLSALWLTLDALVQSGDVAWLNLLTYAAGVVLALAAWQRALNTRGGSARTVQNGH